MNYTYKQIWLINFPVMMSILMEQLINITDAVFLGHVGEIELGASAIAGIYYLAVYMLGFGFSIGLQVMIARKNGEQDYQETGKIFFQGLLFLMGLALFLYLTVHIVSPVIFKRSINSPEIYQAIIRYLDWRSLGLLFSFPFLAIRSFLVGITYTRALSGAAIVAIGINIPLNYFLIFMQHLGISGAAIASSLAEGGSFITLCIYMWIKTDKIKYGLRTVYDGQLLIAVLKLSVWSMSHAFISVAPWFLFFVGIEHLGKTELAVSNITRSVSALFFVIVNSFAVTTGALVRYSIGIPLIGIVLICHRSIIGIYTTDESLIQSAVAPLVVTLLNYSFALPGYVYLNAVGGTGKTKITFIFQAIATGIYLIYLYGLNNSTNTTLTLYLTAEYLFVILLALQSIVYLKRNTIKKQIK